MLRLISQLLLPAPELTSLQFSLMSRRPVLPVAEEEGRATTHRLLEVLALAVEPPPATAGPMRPESRSSGEVHASIVKEQGPQQTLAGSRELDCDKPHPPDLTPVWHVSWASLSEENDDNDDDDELAPQMPLATKCSSKVTLGSEIEEHEGWQEVRPLRGPCCSTKPTRVLAPQSVPAWLHGRCCRCLITGHRAVGWRNPFRCSCCLDNGHGACECRNASRPLSSLANLVVSPLFRLDSGHRLDPTPYEAQAEATLPFKGSRHESWSSAVSASAGSTGLAKAVPWSIFSAIDELQGLASSQMV
ncbi:hypothetical protein D1007_02394 [Hordeum vulgare]|nr:hypothetical protein D1007_02394 [Hordeum vulgare]